MINNFKVLPIKPAPFLVPYFVQIIMYYIMGISFFNWSNVGVLVEIGDTICHNESFQIYSRSWRNIHINFLIAIVYPPSKHGSVHSSVACSENIESIWSSARPKRVELEQEI